MAPRVPIRRTPVLRRLRDAIPRGGGVPVAVARRRHHTLLAILWLQVVGIAIFGLARDVDPPRVVGVLLPSVVLGMGAAWPGLLRMRARAALAALALLATSAALIDLWHGAIEAHLHLFVMLALVALYQDRLHYLIAVVAVFLHDGVLGTLTAGHVVARTDDAGDAWAWALVHALVVAAASAATVASWRHHEDARAEADGRAREQEALRRVAEAVAAGRRTDDLLDLAAAEAAALLGAPAGVVVRTAGAEPEVVGLHGLPAGTGWPLDDPVVSSRVAVGGRPWGLVAVTRAPGVGGVAAERRLGALARLLGVGIENAEVRTELERRASSDPLTGLANHRDFHERLRAEVARAARHSRPLSLILFDLDHFKRVNDAHGHQVGDEVLAEFAERLRGLARDEDLVARTGGEEFAVLLPETTAMEAMLIAERALAAVRGRPFPGAGTLTVSAGICDLDRAGAAEELTRLADGALYWAKAHGRDVAFVYSPEVVEELSADERAGRLARQSNLASLRALAQAVDAKDTHKRRHSERVADLAVRLGLALGWSPVDCARIREAGLLHDVGKIGVPDQILLKAGPLTGDEYEQVKAHAALGAQIASEVLDAEQVLWVRHHHERIDGAGYPDGIRGADLSEGAMIMAVADSWDAMTGARTYRDALPVERAIAECRAQAGRHFAAHVVDALERLWEVGALDPPEPGSADPAAGVSASGAPGPAASAAGGGSRPAR